MSLLNPLPEENSKRSAQRLRLRRRASTIVEFALVLPILLVLLLGVMEFAWLGRTHLALANAAREGARTAALGATTTNIRTRVINAARPVTLNTSHVSLNYSLDNGVTFFALGDSGTQNSAPAGSMVRVQINYTQSSLTGFFSPLNNYPYALSVVMRREAT